MAHSSKSFAEAISEVEGRVMDLKRAVGGVLTEPLIPIVAELGELFVPATKAKGKIVEPSDIDVDWWKWGDYADE